MALSPFKTFSPGEILTAADLNSSFSQITTNGESLGWPATTSKDLDGNTLIIDSDGDSSLRASADDVVTMKLQNVDLFVWDGDAASPVNGLTFTATATGTAPIISATGSDTNISLTLAPKGTGDITLQAGGSETDIKVRAIGSATNIALHLQGKGDGKVLLGDASLEWPDSDGSAGEVLTTDGSATLSFAPGMASGDRLIFQQTTPSGAFTKDTNITSNSALRLITGTVTNDLTGSAFTSMFASRTSGNQSASHSHTITVTVGARVDGTPDMSIAAGSGGSYAHTHSDTSSAGNQSASHNHVTDFKVDYYDATIGEAA